MMGLYVLHRPEKQLGCALPRWCMLGQQSYK